MISLKFEEGNHGIIHNLLRIHTHNEICMSIVISILNRDLVTLMRFEIVQQKLHIIDIGECILSPIAKEQREVIWDARQIIDGWCGLPIMLHVIPTVTIVIHCYGTLSNHCPINEIVSFKGYY